MFVKNFVIDLKGKKLWIIIGLALITSITLIILSFVQVSKGSNGISFDNLFSMLSKENIFNMSSYYSECEATVLSNKNRNVYNFNEWYQKNKSGNETFRFEFLNNGTPSTTYIFKDNILQVKNIDQISVYSIEQYLIQKTNLFSTVTFIDMYNKIENGIKDKTTKDEVSKCFKIENKSDDSKIYLTILFSKENIRKSYLEMCKMLDGLLSQGMNVERVELVLDKKTNTPNLLNVYDDKDKIWLAITYKTFKINAEIDEKIFAF